MKENYHRISYEERIEIYRLLALKESLSSIARTLGRNKSTISREVGRLGRKKYKPYIAETKSAMRQSSRRYGKTKIKMNSELNVYVDEHILKKWSPDQISVSLRNKFTEPSMHLSPESIYMYVHVHSKPELRATLLDSLRQKRKIRGNVRRGKDKRGTISDVTRIDERPAEVEGREIPGHWEGDLILGQNRESAIESLF